MRAGYTTFRSFRRPRVTTRRNAVPQQAQIIAPSGIVKTSQSKACGKTSIGLPRQDAHSGGMLEIIAYHEAGHSNTIRESVWVFRTWLTMHHRGV